MPFYDYQCSKCGRIIEVRHGINEDPDIRCTCEKIPGPKMERMIAPVPVIFKGKKGGIHRGGWSGSRLDPKTGGVK